MALKPLHLIVVGRTRANHWREAAAHYLQRLGHWRKITETIIRDGDPALPLPQRVHEEGQRILAAIHSTDIVVCLDELGKSMPSRQFATFLDSLSAEATPCFIVGGAFGLDQSVRDKARHLLALGPQTLPHELARVVLLEQLYRAESLLRNTPYHH